MSELDRLVRRLRGYSTRAWSDRDRRTVVRRLADDLVALAGSGHELPDVPEHAWPDAIAVLTAEAEQVEPAKAADLIRAALRQLN